MESERITLKAPHSRYNRGVKDVGFKNSHMRLVREHDKMFIERHNLAGRIDEAWEKCLVQKPADPLVYIANMLAPFEERKLVLQLQDELADMKATHPSRPELSSCVMFVSEEESALVVDSFTSMMAEASIMEEFYGEIATHSQELSDRLRGFDDACSDPCQQFLGMLRLFTNNIAQPSLTEGFIRDLARRHIAYGIIERDYNLICSCVLHLVRRHLLQHAKERNNAVKRAWVKLHSLMSTTMAAGSQMRELHAKHQTSLSPCEEDLVLIRESLQRVKDKESAAAAIARGMMEISPAAAAVVRGKGLTPTMIGMKLLDGVELIVDMLQERGLKPALSYLQYLGHRHAGYGVTQAMYPAVGQALLSAASHSLAKDSELLVDHVTRAWRKTLDSLSGILKRPLLEGEVVPSSATMRVSELRHDSEMDPHLEEDMTNIVSGRATPELDPTHSIDKLVGDVSGVPVSDAHLQALFKKYDRDGCEWLTLDTMLEVVMSQECFGVPLNEAKVRAQIEAIVAGARTGKSRVNFHLFSIIMLRLAQR